MSKFYVIEVVQTREDGGTTVRTSWMSNGDALIVQADSEREAFDEAMNAASPEMREVMAGWNETGEWTLRPREAQMRSARMDINRVFDELEIAQAKAEADWDDRNYVDDERDQLDYAHNFEPPCSQY